MDRPQNYHLTGYGEMLNDRPRMEAYATALKRAIEPGCVVLEIGAGPGIFSLLGCRFGASQVHAVDPDDSLLVAKMLAAANGLEQQITFHPSLSTEVTLPKPADVIISDLRGTLPLLQGHIPAIVDARERHLARGGRLIPRCDTIWAALVEAPDEYRRFHQPWVANDWGLDLRAAHPLVVNTTRKAHLKPENLLVEPGRWATLDYQTIESPHVDSQLQWTAHRPGTAHGVLLWFDADLMDGIGFSNAPGEPELIYGQLFLPLEEPVNLSVGDQVKTRIAANLVAQEYVWRWETEVWSPPESSAAPATPRTRFQQSTFLGGTLGLEKLRRVEAGFTPKLSARGEVDLFLLSRIDGNTSLGEIAVQAAQRYPEKFPRWQDALTRVAKLAIEFGA